MRKAKTVEKLSLIILGILSVLIFLELSLRFAGFFSKGYTTDSIENFRMSDENVYRIICLGDSWTKDMAVSKVENYPAQLERILNAGKNKRRFKVYNLGFPNFNSTMILRKFKNAYSALSPDAVVVMMGRSDRWNFTGLELNRLRLGAKIKLLFLKSRVGELVEIFKYNLQYKLKSSKNIRGVVDEKETETRSLKNIYELVTQGDLYRSKGMFDDALNAYKRALQIEENHTVALLELSRCYKFQRKYDLAVAALLKILETDPHNEKIYSEFDDIFIQQKQPKKTVDFYRRLFSEYPENVFIRKRLIGAFIVLADALFEEERFEEVIDNYMRALAIAPDNENIHNGLIYNLAILQKAEKGKVISPKPFVKASGLKAKRCEDNSSINGKSREYFSRNLKELIKICARENMQLIFSSYPKEMPDLMQENAYVYGIPIVDHRMVFDRLSQKKDSAELFSKDGHCSKEGYMVLAENIARKILELIEK